MAFPPTISESVGEGRPKGVFGRSQDPAKYVVERSRFTRPTLEIPGGAKFEWPNGVEGMRVAGQVGNARHKYIGDNADVVQVMHRDSRTIEMTGQFNGITGSENVRDLVEVITAVSPKGYWILTLPSGVLPTKVQYVNIDSYDFDHPFDDRMDAWNYTISFIRIGVGKNVTKKKTVASPSNPIAKNKVVANKGVGTRTFTTHAGGNTLRAVAKLVYDNPDRWREIYNANIKALTALNIPMNILPTKPLPLGLKLKY
jgi:hypothetical protein